MSNYFLDIKNFRQVFQINGPFFFGIVNTFAEAEKQTDIIISGFS